MDGWGTPSLDVSARLDRPLRRDAPLNKLIVCGSVLAGDALALAIAAKAAFWGRFIGEDPPLEPYLMTFGGAALLLFLAFRRAGLYRFEVVASWPRWTGRLIAMVGAAAVLLIASLYLMKRGEDVSRVWLLTTFAGTAALMLLQRGLLALFVARRVQRGTFTRSVAVVGAGVQGRQFLEHLQTQGTLWKRVVGVFDDRRTRLEAARGTPFRGDLGVLEDDVRAGRIDEVIITLPWSARSRIVAIVNRLRDLPVDIYLGSDLIAYALPAHQPGLIAGMPTFHMVRVPLSGLRLAIKWVEDKVLAFLLLMLVSPVLLAIAVAIRIDSPGPILFRQKRYGFNNGPITVLKFRSMRHEGKGARFRQATRDDDRVTRIGRFLRQSSLDELPQLLNVLNGSMSLVGPRPHPVELNEQFAALIDGYNGRHRVKPGITGWAQVNGFRGETDTIEKMQARIEHDVWYIENWSLWLDLRILLMTVAKGLVHPHAY
ncbi:MAG: undecaprenyl-phosphate glucose phosphotransferase [Rhodospirillales bacterium]|nr:undecaprenyl-phosphate glucose phosphotransferase [Rhodospirillales bacterium]